MRQPTTLIIAAVAAMVGVGRPAVAQERDHWHGEIHRFEGHDLERWRGGRWWHGNHEGRPGWWWIVGGVWYFYPSPVYPYPDPYHPPTAQFWYYCANPPGYYPYVPACPTPWQAVPAAPPPGPPPG